ncbi:hypothetical protein OSTOST_15436 [Ostertagia ostertagi]
MENIEKITEDPENIVEVDINGANTPTTTLSPPTTVNPKPGVVPTPSVVKALVFIVDASEAVSKEAWNGQIQLVSSVVKYVKCGISGNRRY